ncbi:MAG TPA: sulfur carrier protein ThiS [Vicinamibacteria bacterium]|nr:sulfur carrier protein ThiS [Vicinamibacteria bacterium]
MIALRVNGREREVPEGTGVGELVALVTGRDEPAGVAVALNGRVVPRSSWRQTGLQAGDAVEIVQAVQGG